MRSPEDLVRIRVKLSAVIDLDRERVVEDPAWAAVADPLDLSDPEQLEQALQLYLAAYLRREMLFDTLFMPSTNGPAEVSIDEMEVIRGTGDKGSNAGGGGT